MNTIKKRKGKKEMKRRVLTLVFFATIMFAGSVVSANNCVAKPNWFEVLRDSGWTGTSTFVQHPNGFWAYNLPRLDIDGVWGGGMANPGISFVSASWYYWKPDSNTWVSCAPNNKIDGRYSWCWYTGANLNNADYAPEEHIMYLNYQLNAYGCPYNTFIVDYAPSPQ